MPLQHKDLINLIKENPNTTEILMVDGHPLTISIQEAGVADKPTVVQKPEFGIMTIKDCLSVIRGIVSDGETEFQLTVKAPPISEKFQVACYRVRVA